MNAIRPSDPKVPALQQYYVYSADNNHVGPVSAELIARGVMAGKVPEDAFIAPTGSNNWTPISHIAEVFGAVSQAKMASTPPPPPPLPARASASQSNIPLPLPNPLPLSVPPPPPMPADVVVASPFAPAPSVSLQPVAPPVAPLPVAPEAVQPASVAPPAAPAPVAAAPEKKEEKKEEKKPVLDPRFKLLPIGIFALFAFVGVIETAVVMIFR